eukprot:scaffold5459_cov23-Tisochrysis_lutea.AAC.1
MVAGFQAPKQQHLFSCACLSNPQCQARPEVPAAPALARAVRAVVPACDGSRARADPAERCVELTWLTEARLPTMMGQEHMLIQPSGECNL